LIEVVNLVLPEEADYVREARDSLRSIARAFLARRRGESDARAFIQITGHHTIKLNLEARMVEFSEDELTLAFEQIEPPSRIDLIRECPICSLIFWAGRSDKETCGPEHSGVWRKREQRRKDRERKEERAKERAKRIKRRANANKPFKLSKTTATILDAVDDRNRTFKTIDDYCNLHLRKHKYSRSPGVYRTVNVTRGLKLLTELGFLQCSEPEEGDPYYTAGNKATQLRRELLVPKGKAHYLRYTVED